MLCFNLLSTLPLHSHLRVCPGQSKFVLRSLSTNKSCLPNRQLVHHSCLQPHLLRGTSDILTVYTSLSSLLSVKCSIVEIIADTALGSKQSKSGCVPSSTPVFISSPHSFRYPIYQLGASPQLGLPFLQHIVTNRSLSTNLLSSDITTSTIIFFIWSVSPHLKSCSQQQILRCRTIY